MGEPAVERRQPDVLQESPAARAKKDEQPEPTPALANDGLTAVLQRPRGAPPPNDGPELTPALLMQLQRTSGNAAVEALLNARRRPAVQRCPDHSCGGNCGRSHTTEDAKPEEEKPIQRFSLMDALPMGVGLMERLMGGEKDKTPAGESPPKESAEGGAKDSSESGARERTSMVPPRAARPEGAAPAFSSLLGGKASPEKAEQPAEGEKAARPEAPEAAVATIAPPTPDSALAGAAATPTPPPPATAGEPIAAPAAGAPVAHASANGEVKSHENGHGSSPMSLIQSLASVPASVLGQALGRTSEAANLAHAREVASMVGAFPRIVQPTGLPAIVERKPAPPTVLPEGKVPEARTPQPSPPPQGGSEIRETPQGGIEVGEKPTVPLTGEADPAFSAEYHAETEQAVSSKSAEAETAAAADFGEKNTFPTIHPELLHPATQPAPPAGVPHSAAPVPPPIPDAARAEFDHEASPWLKEHVGEQLAQRREHEVAYAKTTREVKEAGHREIEEETTKARIDQRQMREDAQAGVEAERFHWRQENRTVTETYQQQAGSKRQEVEQEISGKVQTAEREAGDKLTEAQKKADQERHAAEAKAAQAKKDAESKPESWWDKAKGAVSGAFEAIKGAVAGIFDGLRQIVKGIIEVAKQAAHAVIDAARTVVVGLIRTFGAFLKGLATVALLAFPALAAKMRARIDALVNAATEGINKMAEDLKKRADVVLDKVGKALDTALRVLQAGFTAILSGLEKLATLPFEAIGALARFIEMIKPWEKLLEGGKKLEETAESVINQIKTALGEMIAQVPEKVDQAVNFAIENVGGPIKRHLAGIWRHLKKGLAYLKDNWWAEIKKTAWHLVWPWPTVWKDLKEIWKEIKAAKKLLGNFEISQAINHGLKILQTLNGVAGNLYGWFFIGSVLVGTIIGAFFGGAGAIPGALAGLAVAAEVGEGLLASLIATETLVIGKGIWDLAFGSGKKEENEDAYERIAGSGLTLGITGAMMVLGEIAADIAKSVFDAVVDLLRGEPPAVEVPTETLKGEAPSGEPAGADATGDSKLPAPEDQRVLAEQPTANGEHEIKVTEDGTCLICSTCEEVRLEYADELKDNPDLEKELSEANTIEDPDAKAKRVGEIEQKLNEARQAKVAEGEPVEPAEPAQAGALDESARQLSPQERAIADQLTQEGHDVRALAEDGGGRHADVEVDGVRTEFKSMDPGATDATVRNQVNNSVRRGGQARNMVLDARGSGLTEDLANQGLRRASGITRGRIDSVRIIGDGFDITSTNFR